MGLGSSRIAKDKRLAAKIKATKAKDAQGTPGTPEGPPRKPGTKPHHHKHPGERGRTA